jgi:hypothetical protein
VSISLLTPYGALIALLAIAPLTVYVLRERHARRARRVLGLSQPRGRSHISLVAALAAVPALLGLAAAQPVVAESRTLPERTDAQVFVVLDISRSMLASSANGAPTRFDRATEIARRLRADLPDVPMGIASMTTGMLPHLFPTTDPRVFSATLEDTLGVGRVWTGLGGSIATSIDAIGAAGRLNYFPPTAEKRVIVVLTDGESLEQTRDLGAELSKEPRVHPILVHTWRDGEKVFTNGIPEAEYVQDAGSRALLEGVAVETDGELLSESEAGSLASRVQAAIGAGPTIDREQEGERRALMPYVTLLVLLPLGFVLLRRNV